MMRMAGWLSEASVDDGLEHLLALYNARSGFTGAKLQYQRLRAPVPGDFICSAVHSGSDNPNRFLYQCLRKRLRWTDNAEIDDDTIAFFLLFLKRHIPRPEAAADFNIAPTPAGGGATAGAAAGAVAPPAAAPAAAGGVVSPSEQFTFRVRKWEGGRPQTTSTLVSCLADECKDMCGPGTMYYFPTSDMSQPVKLPSAWDPTHAAWKTLRRADRTAPRVILVLPDAEHRRNGSPASTPRGEWTAVGVPLPDNFKAMFETASAGDASDSSPTRKTKWSHCVHSSWGDQCAITGESRTLGGLEAAHIVSLGKHWANCWPTVDGGEYQQTWNAAGQLLQQTKFRAFVMHKAAWNIGDHLADGFETLNVPWNGILMLRYLHSRFDSFDLSLYQRGGHMLCRAWRRPDAPKHASAADAFMALDGTQCAWRDTWEHRRDEEWMRRLLALHHGICAVKNLRHLQEQKEAERKYLLEDAQAAALHAHRLIAACVMGFEARALPVVVEDG